MWSDRPRCSQGAALVRMTVSGTKKCPEEPRLRVTKPIREPVESFGIRCPSGQEQLWAWPTRLAMGDIHKVRDFEVATRGHLHSRLHSPLDGLIPSPPQIARVCY